MAWKAKTFDLSQELAVRKTAGPATMINTLKIRESSQSERQQGRISKASSH